MVFEGGSPSTRLNLEETCYPRFVIQQTCGGNGEAMGSLDRPAVVRGGRGSSTVRFAAEVRRPAPAFRFSARGHDGEPCIPQSR